MNTTQGNYCFFFFSLSSFFFFFFWWQKPKITIQLAVMDGGHASRCSQLFLEFYLFISHQTPAIFEFPNYITCTIFSRIIVKFLFKHSLYHSLTRLWHYFMCKHSMYQFDSPPGPPPTKMKRKESKYN